MKTAIAQSTTFTLGLAFLAGSGIALAEMPQAAEACVACHQETGISENHHVPIIAGASAYFLENQLAIFDAEARPCEEDFFTQKTDVSAVNHCAAAASLSEDEVAELAEYYASQPFKPAEQEFDAALADQGESIHAKSCDRCHSDAGSLALDDAGILAGQWKPYLMEQLEYYKAGERWQPEKMAPATEDLSEQDMKALVEYYTREGG
ncbi:MAG: c-type cytochrome [Wenzhouxiangellaceae bacterium]|nr:c-type cytochrome [Wenzhouxiangellaceae bacterium]